MLDLTLRAEHQKLARLLGCAESRIEALAGLDVAALRSLRAACTAMLFDGDRASLQRVAAVARLMPGALNAVIAEKAMGPVLASRVAGLLPPKVAVDIAMRVPLAFNTEVTLYIDPRSAVPMLQAMPDMLVVGVARELCRRREFITMARFVDALTDAQIRAVMAALDDEGLLRTGFYVESAQRLEEVVDLLSPERLRAITALAAHPELDLGGAIVALLDGVSRPLRLRIIGTALEHPDARVGEALVAAARTFERLDLLRSVADDLASTAAQRLAALLG